MSKEKLNFAQRVRVKTTPREISNHGANLLKIELNQIINNHKIHIDKSVFKKSDKEKTQLKIAKKKWKDRLD